MAKIGFRIPGLWNVSERGKWWRLILSEWHQVRELLHWTYTSPWDLTRRVKSHTLGGIHWQDKTMHTSWNTGIPIWKWERTCLPWQELYTGRGFSERLWNFPHWRYSKPNWTQFWAACASWPCLQQGVWSRWSLKVPSNLYMSPPVILQGDTFILEQFMVYITFYCGRYGKNREKEKDREYFQTHLNREISLLHVSSHCN